MLTPDRYFLSKILDNVGIHDNRVKSEINLAMTCWGFVNATALALTVPRMKRRTAYLVSLPLHDPLASNNSWIDLHMLSIACLHRMDHR